MVELGRKYPDCGYGPSFYQWIISEEHKPYGSFGNGAAMRISPVGVAINSIDKMKALMKEYFGITVPMLYYKNHGPFRLDIGMMPIKIHYALTVELK